jgi:4-amino-4-deoxy-L-arabinose transferase-like glycosyltransferase
MKNNPAFLSTIALKNKHILIITLLFLFNLLIKLLFITKNQIDIDEPFSIYWAQAGLKDLFGLFKDENNPPTFFLLLHFWIKIFGTSIFSVRFLPALFASLSVIFVYRTGNRFFNQFIAVVASLLYTFSDLATYHAHDTRVYSLFIFLSTVSMYYLLRLFENPTDRKVLWWWIITNILLTYSHFYGFLLLSFQFIFLCLNRNFRSKLIKPLIAMILALIIAYLPYIKLILMRFMSAKGGTWVGKPGLQDPYFRIVDFSNQPVPAIFFLLVIVAGIILLIKSKSKVKSEEWAVYLWFLAPFVFMYFISFKIPMFIPKYMVYILPGFYLTVSIILYRITEKHKKLQLWSAILAIVLMVASSNPAIGNNRQPKETAEFVKNNKDNNTVVFLCPPWLDINIAYYYNIEIFNDFGNVRNRLNEENIFPIYSFGNPQAELLKKAEKAIFIDGWYQVSDPEGTILKNLKSHFNNEELTTLRGYRVYYYTGKK